MNVVEAVQADLARVGREPRSAVRWVRLDALHLTLRFLGPTELAQTALIAAAVERAAAGAAPFDLTVGGGGAFPSPARPRTLWVGILGGGEGLARLADRVETELERAGWDRSERAFRPHVTVARADGRRDGPAAARVLAEHANGLAAAMTVDRIVLFESVTGRGPARYEPLATFPLAAQHAPPGPAPPRFV